MSLRVTWEDPEVLNGVLNGFVLQLSNSQISTLVDRVNVSARVHQYKWTGLHPYYSYEVSIAALTSAGRGSDVVKRVQMPEAGT